MQTKITLSPEAAALTNSMRSMGYSFHDSVADVVDNSVSAGANNINIECDYDCAEPYFSIFDDGCGMSDRELRKAMTYGSRNPDCERESTDLGRFGLGLKVASLSQCSKLTVVSKKDNHLSAYCWDLDVVQDDNAWNVLVINPCLIDGMQMDALINSESGTLVIWNNFDILSKGTDSVSSALRNALDSTRNHLSLVFHRFIDKKEDARDITIRVNGHILKAIDPFLKDNHLTIPKFDDSFEYHGQTVYVKGYVIPHINQLTNEEIDSLGGKGRLNQLQGFYIYREKRLIMPGGSWFKLTGKSQLQNLARVQIDIPNNLDKEWKVDIKKASVSIPEDFKNKLRPVLKDVVKTSTNVYVHRGKKTLGAENRIFVRRDCKTYITYEINRDHPAIKSLLDNDSVSREFGMILTMIEHSMPYDDLRNDFEEKIKPNSMTPDEMDDYLQFGIMLLKSGSLTFEELETKEPYCYYGELLERLREV